MIKIDWKNFAISFIIVVIIGFGLNYILYLSGFCLNPPLSDKVDGQIYSCLKNADNIMMFDILTALIILIQTLAVPVIAYAVGITFYLKKQKLEKTKNIDTLLSVALIFGVAGGSILFLLSLNSFEMVGLGLYFILTLLIWLFCTLILNFTYAILGGIVAHLVMERM